MRETLFDVLGESIRGSIVIDAFAGTGAVGLEAISRGSSETLFIESDRVALSLIENNLRICGVVTGYRILSMDVRRAFRVLGRERIKADILFMDPAYNWRSYDDLLDLIFELQIMAHEGRVIVEHHRSAQVPDFGKGLVRIRSLRQSEKCLSFYAERTV